MVEAALLGTLFMSPSQRHRDSLDFMAFPRGIPPLGSGGYLQKRKDKWPSDPCRPCLRLMECLAQALESVFGHG